MNEQTTDNETTLIGDGELAETEALETESPEKPDEPEKPKKKLPLAAKIGIGVLAALVTAVGGFTARAMLLPFGTELGEPVDLGLAGKLPAAIFAPSSLESIDTSTLGEYPVKAKLFSLVDATVTVSVRDTTPPRLALRELTIMPDFANLAPEDFVELCEDKSAVTFAFKSAPELGLSLERSLDETLTATLIATDACGNVTKAQVSYKIASELAGMEIELGTPRAEIDALLAKKVENSKLDALSEGEELRELGFYTVRSENTLYGFELVDTTPPKADVRDLDLLVGTEFGDAELAQLVANLVDESEVTISSDSQLDLASFGVQPVDLILTDAAGNQTELHAKLRLYPIVPEITVEAGMSNAELIRTLLEDCIEPLPTPDSSFDIDRIALGTHQLKFNGSFTEFEVSVTKIDTVAPKIKLRDLETDQGALPKPSEFVASAEDATSLSYAYAETPDVDKTGETRVTIIATDEGGNTAEGSAKLTVVSDTTPPVISGVRDLYAYEGDTIAYRAGVTAYDAADGKCTVTVDASRVKTSVAGKYKVIYTATDTSGNTATKSATIEIRKVTQATLDEYADKILKEIITEKMTERQKALAIYDWCRENLKYSTVTSHLMGYYYKAAYSGYRLHYGNCYTYYAVARSLLTRAGIENMMIQRNSTTRPHYWNLVKIKGNWYHFDTCPQPSPNNDGCFLLTDAEVAEYSRTKQIGYYNFAKNTYPATP